MFVKLCLSLTLSSAISPHGEVEDLLIGQGHLTPSDPYLDTFQPGTLEDTDDALEDLEILLKEPPNKSPLNVRGILDSEALKEFTDGVRFMVHSAPPEYWRTEVTLPEDRTDGFKSLSVAHLDESRGVCQFTLTRKPAELGDDPERALGELVRLSFADSGGIPEEFLVDATSSMAQSVVPSLIKNYVRRIPEESERARLLHKNFIMPSKGLLTVELRRGLVCAQAKVENIALQPGFATTMRYHNVVSPIWLARAHAIRQSALSKSTFPDQAPKIFASSDWKVINPSAFAGKIVESSDKSEELDELKSRLDQVWDCHQDKVLRKEGVMAECVSLDWRSKWLGEEVLTEEDRFQMKCLGLYPPDTVWIGYQVRDVINRDTKRQRLETKWTYAHCGPTGWTEPQTVREEVGKEAYQLCVYDKLRSDIHATSTQLLQILRK